MYFYLAHFFLWDCHIENLPHIKSIDDMSINQLNSKKLLVLAIIKHQNSILIAGFKFEEYIDGIVDLKLNSNSL